VEQINLDLTYAICFNLANAYYHNKMYEEALNTYQLIVKNKQYPQVCPLHPLMCSQPAWCRAFISCNHVHVLAILSQSGRLRVNMGNIYYEQRKYPQAIKMYRMALDQIPSTGKVRACVCVCVFACAWAQEGGESPPCVLTAFVDPACPTPPLCLWQELRFRIFRNIGNAFVKLGQFQDAVDSYESIMTGSAGSGRLRLWTRSFLDLTHRLAPPLASPVSPTLPRQTCKRPSTSCCACSRVATRTR
jgi:intraflagellar transport protein 88